MTPAIRFSLAHRGVAIVVNLRRVFSLAQAPQDAGDELANRN